MSRTAAAITLSAICALSLLVATSTRGAFQNPGNASDREKIVKGLSRVLADTYVVYLKTHNFHWNVTGPMFNTLHLMFMGQYNELWLALDLIAERIRSLGHFVPSLESVGEKSTLKHDTASSLSEDQMLGNLAAGNEAVVKSARSALKLAEDAGDQATADLMTQRVSVGEKAAWMLRAHLAK